MSRDTLVAHTHWERESYQPHEIFRVRLLQVLDEALELMERDPRLTFTLDGQVAMVEDYLELRPAMEPRIREFVAAGRLHIGPFFTQADTLMVGGEAIVRNLAYGIRRAEALGGSMHLGYMPEQLGHAAQVPQLLRLLGIESAVLWRGVGPERPRQAFIWVAPDGSAVTAIWLQEGYATGRQLLSDSAAFSRWPESSQEHRRPSFWPDVEAPGSRRPEILVAMGGYADHFGPSPKVEQRVYGELRSSAFASVQAGVASCRMREKQAAARATTRLTRYAEPLCAWAMQAGLMPPGELLGQAWRQLLLNQEHDSAAGCGTDEAHEAVKRRYHFAERLANTCCEQILAALCPQTEGALPANLFVYHPGPQARSLLVEAEVPRELTGSLVAYGTDGIAYPVQSLPSTQEFPRFDGERAGEEEWAGELAGRDASPTRRVLVAAGPAVAAGLCPIWLRCGAPSAEQPRAWAVEGVIAAGPLRVMAQPDGTVWIEDVTGGSGRVIANDLIDQGDRGDLYHFAATGTQPVRAHAARTCILEAGPLRARLRIEQDLALPTGLFADRHGRAATTRVTTITTDITVVAGERRVEFVTTLHNEVPDHRLRALFHLPFQADRLDIDQGLMVTNRPLDARGADGGSAGPALTGIHQVFVDASDGRRGAAVLARGLPEHELVDGQGQGTVLALTLLRSVGWLSASDRSGKNHTVGRMVPTPEAQEFGPHRFEYALLLHAGNWEAGEVLADAQRYAAPPQTFVPGGTAKVGTGRSLVEITPSSVVLLAAYASAGGVVIRLLNAAPRCNQATVQPAFTPGAAVEVDPLERPVQQPSGLSLEDGVVRISLRPWQIATLLIRP